MRLTWRRRVRGRRIIASGDLASTYSVMRWDCSGDYRVPSYIGKHEIQIAFDLFRIFRRCSLFGKADGKSLLKQCKLMICRGWLGVEAEGLALMRCFASEEGFLVKVRGGAPEKIGGFEKSFSKFAEEDTMVFVCRARSLKTVRICLGAIHCALPHLSINRAE